jgi:hypothetical protein
VQTGSWRKQAMETERPTLGFEEGMQIFAFTFIKPPVLTGIVKKKKPILLCLRKRERHIWLLFIHQDRKLETHFFSLFFNKCKGNKERERPIFVIFIRRK